MVSVFCWLYINISGCYVYLYYSEFVIDVIFIDFDNWIIINLLINNLI